MSNLDFTVGDHQYRMVKMDAFAQLHIIRKMAPILPHLGGLGAAQAAIASGDGASMQKVLSSLQPFMDAMAALPDEACEYVLQKTLAVVKRSVGDGQAWQPIWNKQANQLQFQDLGLLPMMTIVANVLRETFQSFFPAADPTSE